MSASESSEHEQASTDDGARASANEPNTDAHRSSTSTRGPRVLVSGVVLSQPMGGVRRHNAELLPRLARRCADAGGELAILAPADGLPFEVEGARLVPSTVPAGPPLRRALTEGHALRAELERARDAGRPFDLVHTAHFPVPRGIEPFTLTVHDLRSLELRHTPLSRRLVARSVLGRAFARAARVFCVSEGVRSELSERFGLSPARSLCLSNAADHFDALPREPQAPRFLLHVGHLEPRKNLALVLEALALDPSLPRLVLAGAAKHGEDEHLRARARELGIDARVEFLGPFDDTDLPSLLARTACVVLPSRLEGFGIPVLEAQRAGAPLAIADAGALREVAGDAVPRFAPDDAAGCARAIAAALARPAAELEADRARAERFTWDATAERWFEACRALVRSSDESA